MALTSQQIQHMDQVSGLGQTGGKNWTNTGATGWAVDQLPNIGGTIGAIGGGILGTPGDVLTGPAGTIGGAVLGSGAGGAVGKALQDLLTGKAQSQNIAQTGGDVALSGLGQAPFGLLGAGDLAEVPVKAVASKFGENMGTDALKTILGFGAKTAGRYGVGRVAGGVNAMTSGKNPQQIQQQSSQTGNLNAAFGAGGDVMGSLGKFFLGGIPAAVQERLHVLPEQAAKATKLNLALKDAGQLVGDQNYQYAVHEGILPSEQAGGKLVPNTIHTMENTVEYANNALDKTQSKAQEVENMLQQKLIGSPPIAQEDQFALRNNLKAEFNVIEGQLNPVIQKKLTTMINGADLSNLSKVNSLKRSIGEIYDKSGTARALYSKLKTYIETQSGSDAVKGLNNEAYRLMQIKSNIGDVLKKGAPRTEADVQNIVNEARGKAATQGPSGKTTTGIGSWARNLPPALQRFGVGAGGVGAVLAPAIAKAALGPLSGGTLGAAGVGLGAYFVARQAANHLSETPAGQQWLAQIVSQGKDPVMELGKLMQQVIGRVPSGSQNNQQSQ